MRIQSAVLVIAMSVVAASCQDGGQVYCGRRLSTALALLCENGLIKRGGSEAGSGQRALPWMPAHLARGLARGKRQVVAECCFKPCTLDELVSYCA